MLLQHLLHPAEKLAELLRRDRKRLDKWLRPSRTLHPIQMRHDFARQRPQQFDGVVVVSVRRQMAIEPLGRHDRETNPVASLCFAESRLLDDQSRFRRLRNDVREERVGLTRERQQSAVEQIARAGKLIAQGMDRVDRRIHAREEQ